MIRQILGFVKKDTTDTGGVVWKIKECMCELVGMWRNKERQGVWRNGSSKGVEGNRERSVEEW